MKFMVTITIQNIENEELKSKLEKIIYNEDLELDNILNTANIKENYKKLLLALEILSGKSNTFKKIIRKTYEKSFKF